MEGSGRLGATGPSDRLAVVRYLRLTEATGGAVVTADETPKDLRRRYLMALHDPVVLQRPGLVVLADRWARGRAGAVLDAAEGARPRLARLGLDTSPTVLITVYGSLADIHDALAVTASSSRLVFFSYPPLRVAEADWPIYDVAVLGPWLRDPGVSLQTVLAHELAHAYSVRWFARATIRRRSSSRASPKRLRARRPRRRSATRSPRATSSGRCRSRSRRPTCGTAQTRGVGLGYEVGGSLVAYVVSRWGAGQLRPFVQAVAAAGRPRRAWTALGRAIGVTGAGSTRAGVATCSPAAEAGPPPSRRSRRARAGALHSIDDPRLPQDRPALLLVGAVLAVAVVVLVARRAAAAALRHG